MLVTMLGGGMRSSKRSTIFHSMRMGGLATALLLAGCGGVHLYDVERDEAAQAVVETNKSIDLDKLFTGIRENLDKLYTAQVSAQTSSGLHLAERDIYEVLRVEEEVARNGSPRIAFAEWFTPNGKVAGSRAISYADRDLKSLGFDLEADIDKQLTDAAFALDAIQRTGEISPPASDPNPTKDSVTASLIKEAEEDVGWKVPSPERDSCEALIRRDADWAATNSGLGQDFEIDLVKSVFDGLKARCERLITLEGRSVFVALLPPASRLGRAYQSWSSAHQAISAITGQIKKTKQDIKNATPAAAGDGESVIESFQGKATEVGGLLDKAKEGLGKAIPALKDTLGIEIAISEERIDALSTILTAFETGKSNGFEGESAALLQKDAGLRRAVLVAAALPGIAGDLEKLAGFLDRPEGRAGLLLVLAQETIRLDYLKAQQALMRERLAVAQQTVEAYLQIAVQYRNGNSALKRAGDLEGAPLTAILKEAGSYKKRMAMRGVLSFIRIRAVLYPQAASLEAKLIDLTHREAVLVNEYATKSWKALIDSPVTQIADYWKSGIKPETLAELVVGLGELGLLGVIGVEAVND